MSSFQEIRFNGTFRDYQQRILDNASKYLEDGKVNIVAAPGSGKTTVGLELITRIGKPCIILSPTTTIKYQWGSRLEQAFIGPEKNIDEYISYDLNKISLFNSITYQALYSAMKKVKCESEDETVDYSNIDLFKLINDYGIRTICMDESHHLQNEWQKALESFISGLGKEKDIKIISLTATPPYDANKTEWDRYKAVCGEIDAEIFVPELVKENTLCPHQDYIYFNYPTSDETSSFDQYRTKSSNAINEVIELHIISKAYANTLAQIKNYDMLFSSAKEYIAFLVLCEKAGIQVDKKLIRMMTTSNSLPEFDFSYAQTAIQFMITDEAILSEEDRILLKDVLKKNDVLSKGKVTLAMDSKLKKQLASSVGKLNSISSIAKAESESMGESLRMLILTDYIRKETVVDIGTDKTFMSISVVSIFESVRKAVPNERIGVVSGSLIILPDSILKDDMLSKSTAIAQTGYSVCNLSCSNKEKVTTVSKLFENGDINILIGTKSLLGEGWDSPCVNTLILASFVGSFMLSNQMRGRAIRIDRNNPNKVSNIWHLVTLEPEYLFADKTLDKVNMYFENSTNTIISDDYDTLTRRFECFVGPNYETGEIENGVDRITIIKPPYNAKGINSINQQMLQKAINREAVVNQWNSAVKAGGKLNTNSQVPKENCVRPFKYYDILLLLLIYIVVYFVYRTTATFLTGLFASGGSGSIDVVVGAIASIVVSYFAVSYTYRLLVNSNPHKTIKNLASALLNTLQAVDLISPSVKLRTNESTNKLCVGVSLSRASVYEQNIFNTAIAEMLSPIDNPRYVLVMKRFDIRNYRNSFACPSIIGQRREYVETFKNKLKGRIGNFELIYTRNEKGRSVILSCRRASYISQNAKMVTNKKKVDKWG